MPAAGIGNEISAARELWSLDGAGGSLVQVLELAEGTIEAPMGLEGELVFRATLG